MTSKGEVCVDGDRTITITNLLREEYLMSIESFHRSLHGAENAEPFLTKLRAITKIEDPADILASSDELQQNSGWADWGSIVSGAPGLS